MKDWKITEAFLAENTVTIKLECMFNDEAIDVNIINIYNSGISLLHDYNIQNMKGLPFK